LNSVAAGVSPLVVLFPPWLSVVAVSDAASDNVFLLDPPVDRRTWA